MAWLGEARSGAARLGEAWAQCANKSFRKGLTMKTTQDAELNRLREKILPLFENAGKGDLIPYSEVTELIGFTYQDKHRWNPITNWVRKYVFKESGKVTVCEDGIAFRVLTDGAVVREQAPKRLRKIRGQARRGTREIGTVSTEELTHHERSMSAFFLKGFSQAKKEVGVTLLRAKQEQT
jgi:hypothetical protein